MNKFITVILDHIWNLKVLTGHRSNIAEYGGMLAGIILAYQGLINEGSALPTLPPEALVIAGAVAAFLAKKQRQFVKEHKEKDGSSTS